MTPEDRAGDAAIVRVRTLETRIGGIYAPSQCEAFSGSFRAGLVALGLLGVSSAANLPLAGSLDPSFGSGGVVTHSPGSSGYPIIGGIAVQPDGKIVVVAASGSLVRYLPDGSLDSSFGNGGYVTIGFDAQAVALQPDGKIVVTGTSPLSVGNAVSEFTLARYSPDGSLDTSFGTGGIKNTAFPESGLPWSAAADALAILPDGKIVAAGSASWGAFDQTGCAPPSMFALARYTPDGVLDPTFGVGGIVQTGFDGGQGFLAGIAVQPNGKIVASGTGGIGSCLLRHRLGHVVTAPGSPTMAVARYEPDGSLDPSFGGGDTGTWSTDVNNAYSGGPPVFHDGRIFVTGSVGDLQDEANLVIARYKRSGDFDFIARIRSVIGFYPVAVLAQKDGKILIAGYDTQQGNGVILRLLPNGRLDTSFGTGGIVSPSASNPTALALQKDQKVLVGSGNGNAWTITRLIGGNNCVVPRVDGKTISQATTTLRKSYCGRGRISKRFSGKATRGRVISTEPPRGTRLPGGSRIALVVSKGKRP